MRIQSILLGLYMQDEFIEQQQKKIEKSKDKKIQIYRVYDKKVIDELPEDYRKVISTKFDTHKMRIKIYFPNQFRQLRQMDSKYVNVKKDFDLIENLKILDNIVVTGDGGRSGELLFFNHDNNLLMKTISSNDIQSFNKIGLEYFDYVINKNPDTLISKIYGMYSFTRKDTRDSKTYIIFMRNISNVPTNNILRRYDLKGSRFDREVLVKQKIKAEDLPNHNNYELFAQQYQLPIINQIENNNANNLDINDASYCSESQSYGNEVITSANIPQNGNAINEDWVSMYNKPIIQREDSQSVTPTKIIVNPNLNVAKITLKDVDFLKLENKVNISEKYLNKVKNILERDSQFFKENGLIDYSLLVFKVVRPEQQSYEQKENHVFKSTKEYSIYYHIGIIDYLQQWNIDKLLEQKAKQAIHADLNLNVSSQNPDAYSSRFKQNIIESFF